MTLGVLVCWLAVAQAEFFPLEVEMSPPPPATQAPGFTPAPGTQEPGTGTAVVSRTHGRYEMAMLVGVLLFAGGFLFHGFSAVRSRAD